MTGTIWALSAAVGFSAGHIALSKGIRTTGTLRGTSLMLRTGVLVAAMAAVLVEGVGTWRSATLVGVQFFAAAGLVHFVAGWGFMNASTRLVGPSRMSAITGLTPLFAAAFAVTLLHERVNSEVGLGIVAIVAGAYLVTTS
jgi:drug/metabolite transporter (DMT)-like permease